jgi:RNA polymerase sigma-70 factor (ECF subfamily)
MSEELLARCAGGDWDALAELYDLIAPRVYGLMVHIAQDDAVAADLTIEFFHEFWAQVPTRPDGADLPWLIALAHNMAVRRRREIVGRRFAVTPSWLELPTISSYVGDDERLSDEVCMVLDPDEQRMLCLCYLDGHTVLEAEHVMGLHQHAAVRPIRDALITLVEEAS